MYTDASTFTESFVTNADCGALKSGTVISNNTEVKSVVKDMLYYIDHTNPNTRYESKSLGTWSSLSDVDTFLSAYNHDSNYTGLSLGNYVTINDGTYNTQWEIAGFDCEYNQTAADSTVYDNGYGIVMIPKTTLTTAVWHPTYSSATPYINSDIHKTTLVTAANKLKGIVGSHLISRNVLLGSAQNGTISPRNWTTSAYQWTTSYCTLMSIGQMNGTFASYSNKYDDGEANYKLPLFDHENYFSSEYFWSRGVWGNVSGYGAWRIYTSGSIRDYGVDNTCGVRPLIYLR